MQHAPFILASSSPQRRKLLQQMGLACEVRPVDCAEDLDQVPEAESLVALITRQKMAAAHEQFGKAVRDSAWILSSDTLVALDHHRLGKPADRAEAARFLELLSGREHQVLTGVCLSQPRPGAEPAVHYACSESRVRFRVLDEADRNWYLDSGEWRDAAGGYRIQGRGACLIEGIAGSYTGIVGLPIELVYGMVRQHRYW